MVFGVVIAVLAVFAAVSFALNRWFGRRTARAQAQLAFKRKHGRRVVELLGGGVPPDTRANSPWINIAWGHDGRGTASLASARLHRGRLQAGVRLDDVRLPVEIWHARVDGESDFDVVAGVDAADIAPFVQQLAQLGVDSVSSGHLGDADAPPIVRVQYDDVEDLPSLLERIGEILDAIVELRT